MGDQPPSERYKPEMPEIPGVNADAGRSAAGLNHATRLAGGLLLVLVVAFFGIRILLRARHAEPTQPEAAPQIILPTPQSELQPAVPTSTDSQPAIAALADLAQPWASKNFFFRNRLSGENIPALVLRLPGGPATQGDGYWAFSLQAPYGTCQLEYITDLRRLASDYGFRAKHPMVGNPCSKTVYDPLRRASIPGDVLVRGFIAQGSDIRPPISIEVEVRGKEILATRME